MELSAEQFSRWIGSLNEGPDSVLARQRSRPRVSLDADATLIPVSSFETSGPITVSMRDLSASGVGFLSDRAFGLDEQFALVLPQEADSPAILLCAVAYWQPLAHHAFAIGARFVRVLRDTDDRLPVQLQAFTPDDAAAVRRLRRSA
jgi:hypothetical protein